MRIGLAILLVLFSGEMSWASEPVEFEYELSQLVLPPPQMPEATYPELIQALGSATYLDRRKAFLELLNRGSDAYPAVCKATESDDLEVASSAARLSELTGPNPILVSFSSYAEAMVNQARKVAAADEHMRHLVRQCSVRVQQESQRSRDLLDSIYEMFESHGELVAVSYAQQLVTAERGKLESRKHRLRAPVTSAQKAELRQTEILIAANQKAAVDLEQTVAKFRAARDKSKRQLTEIFLRILPHGVCAKYEFDSPGKLITFSLEGDERNIVIPFTSGLPKLARRAPDFPLVPVNLATETAMENWENLTIAFEPAIRLSHQSMTCDLDYSVELRRGDSQASPEPKEIYTLLQKIKFRK